MEVVRGKLRVLHVLRSVMLAGAGAVVWLALSSTAAHADSGGTNNHTLLGGAESAVTNVVHNASAGITGTPGNPVSASGASVPVPVPVASVPVPVAQLPVVQVPAAVVHELPRLTQAIDRGVDSTPVVDEIIHEGTVAAVTAPVLSPAARAADGVGSGVGSLVGGSITPALGTVGSTVEGLSIGNLPITIPESLGTGGLSEQPSGPASVADGLENSTGSPLEQAVALPPVSLARTYSPLGLPKAPSNAPVQTAGYGISIVPASLSDGVVPEDIPGSSDAGNGSAALPSNPSGAATAWLPGMNLFIPLSGILVSTAAAGRVPAPVSFDPGSSPD